MADEIRQLSTLLQTPRFRVVEVESGGVVRAIVRHPGAVCVIPCVDDDRVCLIRNRRVTVGRELIELPAGTLEVGEDPQLAAVRELAEETGFLAQSCELLREFFLAPGILDERMRLFVARGLTPGPSAREPGEEIENLIVTWREAERMIDRGEIEDAKTLVGLLTLLRNDSTASRG